MIEDKTDGAPKEISNERFKIMIGHDKRSNLFMAAAVLTAAAVLAGCGKTQKFTGGEDIGYPYSYEINGNGTVTVTLDGSASPDAAWELVGGDEGILQAEVKKEEKKGKITYKLTPVADGSVNISFQRERAYDDGYFNNDPVWTIDTHQNSDPSKHEDASEENKKHGDEEISQEAGTADSLPTPDENEVSAEEQKLSSSNVICSISMNISVSSTEKKNKFDTEVFVTAGHLTEGVLSGDNDEVLDYEVWVDELGSMQVKLPMVNGGWTYDYTGVYKEKVHEDIPGIAYDEPEKDENGQYEILDISERGYFGGDYAFIIYGLADGDATIVFTDLGNAYRLTLVVTVDEGRIKLESQNLSRTE